MKGLIQGKTELNIKVLTIPSLGKGLKSKFSKPKRERLIASLTFYSGLSST